MDEAALDSYLQPTRLSGAVVNDGHPRRGEAFQKCRPGRGLLRIAPMPSDHLVGHRDQAALAATQINPIELDLVMDLPEHRNSWRDIPASGNLEAQRLRCHVPESSGANPCPEARTRNRVRPPGDIRADRALRGTRLAALVPPPDTPGAGLTVSFGWTPRSTFTATIDACRQGPSPGPTRVNDLEACKTTIVALEDRLLQRCLRSQRSLHAQRPGVRDERRLLGREFRCGT